MAMDRTFSLKRLDTQKIDIKDNEIILFSCIRDERLRLPYFLKHHRNIGVDRFIFVDNGSNDGTVNFLLSEENTHVFHTNASYAQSNCGMDWLNALLARFGVGHWVLTVDADELFIYPNFEEIKLNLLINYLESTNAQAVATFLLDMYSNQPIKSTIYKEGESFVETCPYFDEDTYVYDRKISGPRVPIRGGPRKRLFWGENDREKPSPVLKKIPFVKWRKDLSYEASTHVINNVRLAKLSGIIQHFKFFSDFYSLSQKEALRKEHWDNAAQYESYWKILKNDPDISPFFEGSARFVNSGQLVDLGMMHLPRSFERFFKENQGFIKSENSILSKKRKKAAGLVIVKNNVDHVQDLCRKILTFCDALLVIVETSEDRMRDKLVQLQKEKLPIILYDALPSTDHNPIKCLLKLGTNATHFFTFDYYFLLRDLQTEPSRNAVDILLNKSFRQNEKLSNINKSLHENQLSRSEAILSIDEISYAFWGNEVKKRNKDWFLSNFKLLQTIIKTAKTFFKKPTSHSSGVFAASFHSQNVYLDYPPFRYIYDKFSPQSVLDLGSGLGMYIKAFKEYGSNEVLGVDGFDEPDDIVCENCYVKHDLRKPLDLGKKFNLVICVEVIEHIDSQYENNLLNSINEHAENIIVFSAAHINQPGVGHINCRPVQYWIAKWKNLGWEVNFFDTEAVRSLGTFYWFRRNLLVLQKRNVKNNYSDKAYLSSYETNNIKWLNQPPATYQYPLTGVIPSHEE